MGMGCGMESNSVLTCIVTLESELGNTDLLNTLSVVRGNHDMCPPFPPPLQQDLM